MFIVGSQLTRTILCELSDDYHKLITKRDLKTF